MNRTAVLKSLIEELQNNRPAALCVIVGTRGSTPQPVGTLVYVDGASQMVGTLGGGCMEAEVRTEAYRVLVRKQSALLTFTLDNDFGYDDGMICGGSLDIAVQTIADPQAITPIRDAVVALEQGHEAVLPVRVPSSEPAGVSGKFVEYRIPLESTPQLVIAGAGHISRSLAAMAVRTGFDVSVVDDRGDLNCARRFPAPINPVVGDIAKTLAAWPVNANTYIVLVTRGHKHDETALAAVLNSPARYIGMIGSQRKIDVTFDDLRHTGANEERLARVHAPIGIDIGSVTADEIAVSIAAQLIAERRKNYRGAVEGPYPASDEVA